VIRIGQPARQAGGGVRRNRRRCRCFAAAAGAGLGEFSLHPATLLEVRRAIRGSDLSALRAPRQLLRARDRAGIEAWLKAHGALIAASVTGPARSFSTGEHRVMRVCSAENIHPGPFTGLAGRIPAGDNARTMNT
jgi:hypothetical protein